MKNIYAVVFVLVISCGWFEFAQAGGGDSSSERGTSSGKLARSASSTLKKQSVASTLSQQLEHKEATMARSKSVQLSAKTQAVLQRLDSFKQQSSQS